MRKLILLLFIVFTKSFSQTDIIEKDTIIQKLDTIKSVCKILMNSEIYAKKDFDCPFELNGVTQKVENGIILSASKCVEYSTEKFFFKIMIKNKTYFIESKNIVVKNKNLFNVLYNLNDFEKGYFEDKNKTLSKIYYLSKLKELDNFIKNTSSLGLLILNSEIYDESEYTEATGFKIEVYNSGTKTIKYIWFGVYGLNHVDDLVTDPVRNQKYITQKGVGPISSENSASYDFENCWFTDIVQTFKIYNIKLQFMDGTFKEIKNIDKVTLPSHLIEYLYLE